MAEKALTAVVQGGLRAGRIDPFRRRSGAGGGNERPSGPQITPSPSITTERTGSLRIA